jgi:iron complex transport system ATP-binding protein
MSIKVKNLTAGYGEKIILNNINLHIKKGSMCALLGKNGSGKTTLFRCINNSIKPKSGDILVENENILELKHSKIAKLISMVPQKTHSVFSYSVLDMVLMGEGARLKSWQAPKEEAYVRATKALGEIGIAHLKEQYYNELSGGEQQLVLLARAIMQDTPVMLLDEPISHLDFYNQYKVMDIMKEITSKKGVTVVIILHDPNVAVNYCDDVVMMDRGRIIGSGKMTEMFNDYNLRRLYGEIITTDYTSMGYQVAVPDIKKRSTGKKASMSRQIFKRR